MMTWSENKKWNPSWSGFPDPSCIPSWMEIKQEIPEFFDFLQKIFGGAIADITKKFDELFDEACAAYGGIKQISINAYNAMKQGIPPP